MPMVMEIFLQDILCHGGSMLPTAMPEVLHLSPYNGIWGDDEVGWKPIAATNKKRETK